MSSILKALKKLEHEKSGHFPDSLNIDSDILKVTDSSPRFSPFGMVLMFLLIFGGGIAVAYFFMKGTKTPLATIKQQPVITVIRNPPQVPPPVIKTETLPAEIIVVPARKEPTVEALRKQHHITAFAGKVADSVAKKPAKAAVSSISEKPIEATKTANRELSDPTVPTLRVNGIAFQNNGADSMAIVNGTPVSNGSIVEGITVAEVQKDRVLFQRNGEKFEIQLGQANR